MSNKKPAIIYAEELLKLDLGYALWEADPYGEYEKVKIGDVGYIQYVLILGMVVSRLRGRQVAANTSQSGIIGVTCPRTLARNLRPIAAASRQKNLSSLRA